MTLPEGSQLYVDVSDSKILVEVEDAEKLTKENWSYGRDPRTYYSCTLTLVLMAYHRSTRASRRHKYMIDRSLSWERNANAHNKRIQRKPTIPVEVSEVVLNAALDLISVEMLIP